MNLKKMSRDELVLGTENAILNERNATADVVRFFREIFERKLYLDLGYPSLFELATKRFGYCAGSAMRRINSMKLVRALPEVESLIESGELTLTAAASVQSFLQTDATSYSRAERLDLVEACVNKSTREIEKELARRNPEREKREFARPISENRIRISFTISEDLNRKLEKLKSLLSHVDGNMTTESLLERLAEVGLEKFDPCRKDARNSKRKNARQNRGSKSRHTDPLPARETSRHIPMTEQREARKQNAETGCDYVDPRSGQRCSSTHFLQIDHIKSYSEGGPHSADNLQILCSAHNQMKWRQRSETRYGAESPPT